MGACAPSRNFRSGLTGTDELEKIDIDLGRPKCQKKKWYSTKPTFWRSGMGKAWKFEISQFLVISGVLRFFTRFGRPFHYIIWKRQSWLKIWKRQSQKIGWYAWAKLSQQLKTGLQHISCRNKKNKTHISRKFAGISWKFADICFNHFKTNISGMCGHGPKISRSRLSIFYFHRTNSPNPWRPDLKENEAVGAAIWQNHLSHFFGFIAIFVFHRVFSNQDGPSRFFPALGFRRYIYIYIMLTKKNAQVKIQQNFCEIPAECPECPTCSLNWMGSRKS